MDLEPLRGLSNMSVQRDQDESNGQSDELMFIRMFSIPCFVILSIVGTITNLFNFVTFLKMRLTDSVTVAFLCLSTFDLGYTFTSFIGGLGRLLEPLEVVHNIRLNLDPVIIFIFTFNPCVAFYCCSSFMIVWIAVQRCCCVTFPFTFRTWFSVKGTLGVVIAASVYNAGFLTAILVNYDVAWLPLAGTNRSKLQIVRSPNRMAIFDVLYLCSITFIFSSEAITIVCTGILIYHLKRSSEFRKSSKGRNLVLDSSNSYENFKKSGQAQCRPRSSSNGSSSPDKDRDLDLAASSTTSTADTTNIDTTERPDSPSTHRQLILSITLISVVFIVSNFPIIFKNLFRFINAEFDTFGNMSTLFLIVTDVQTIFELINTSMNFFIYFTVNSKYRSIFRQWTSCRPEQ